MSSLFSGAVECYQPPYHDVLQPDPPFELVKKVVNDDGYRPKIPNSWTQNEVDFWLISQSQCDTELAQNLLFTIVQFPIAYLFLLLAYAKALIMLNGFLSFCL